MQPRLLIVDDEADVRASLAALLEDGDYEVLSAGDAAQANQVLTSHPAGYLDLVLLDVRLPDESGWKVLEDMRARGDQTPVIFVTGVDPVEERVRGLQLGADDYILKPFTSHELLARIDAVLRRRLSLPVLSVGALQLDVGRRSVRYGDARVNLSPHEFDILRVLVMAKGEPVSRMALLRDVWGLPFDPGTTMVEVQIARLRRKLESHGARMVETIKGQGYRIVESLDDARGSRA